MEEQGIDILERIHASFYQLTTAERKVADYVIANYKQVQFMSITQLADECGTAEATVSRFCRSLKLKGFNAFKLELAKHAAFGSASTQAGNSPDTPGQAAGKLAIDAVQQTVDLINTADVLRAVELFEKASRVMCVGSGGSMIVAQDLAHLFSTVTGKFVAIMDTHMQMSAVATMGTDDVIVLFSYSGATTGGLQILELAKARGIHTILVTRFHRSPAARLADVVLRCGSNEAPFQFGSVPAKIAQMVVMDVLYQEYCHRNQAQCEENLRRVAEALSGVHV